MSKKHLLIALTVIVCLMGAATPAIYSKIKTKPQAQAPQASPLPRAVLYWLMFQHIKTLNSMAEKLEAENKDGRPYRDHYKINAKLDDMQMVQLNQIVEDCYRDVSEMDRRAKALIDEARARVPGGKLEPGQIPPSPPAQLKEMQKERDAMVEGAYNRLRETFGMKEFERFNKFVNEKVAPQVKALTRDDHVRPGGKPQSRITK
jgi:hypothetical protein